MDIDINDIDTDELRDIIQELFGLVIIQGNDDEHLFWLIEGDEQDSAVESIEDLLSDVQQKDLEIYLKEKGYV